MESLLQEQFKKHFAERNYPQIRTGDQINVHLKIKEGDKERVQVFKGIVIKTQGRNQSRSFTVRKISNGVGVEKTIPFLNPNIEKIEKLSSAKVRQSRIFYIRKLKGRSARLQIKGRVQPQVKKPLIKKNSNET